MKRVISAVLAIISVAGVSWASPANEGLLFMGEDTRVVTVASGRPELPKQAPAVVSTLERREIEGFGFRTLSEALWAVPGFMEMRREQRTDLYARGVPSGALFLFDGIPLNTDSTKAVYPLGDEMSTDYIKRLEVVRGPSSVLWGPDAFAGLVNIVPMRGSDVEKGMVKTRISTPDGGREVEVLWGKDWGFMDAMAFARVKGSKGYLGKHSQEFWEGLLNVHYRDSLSLLVRLSKYRAPYTTHYRGTHWTSRNDLPFSMVKVGYRKRLGSYSLNVRGAYTSWEITRKEGNFSWGYKSRSLYGDARLSRELFKRHGLLTIGLSFRRNLAKNAAVSVRGYIPEYIAAHSPVGPITIRRSFDTTLFSAYAQYIHRYRCWELWLGGRWDDHSDYKSSFSYTAGLALYPSKGLFIKAMAGTAYRTPYAALFLKGKNLDPEKISTIQVQMGAAPFKGLNLSATAFYNRIRDHVEEDPWAGYSSPSNYSTRGLELSLDWKPTKILSLWLRHTLLGIEHARERFKVLRYAIITPEGTFYRYSKASKSVDGGAREVLYAGASVHFRSTTAAVSLYYTRDFTTDTVASGSITNNSQFLVNLFLQRQISRNLLISLKMENLLNDRGYSRTTFGREKREGFKAFVTLEYRF